MNDLYCWYATTQFWKVLFTSALLITLNLFCATQPVLIKCLKEPFYPQDRAYEIVEDAESNKVRKMKKRICLVLDCLCAHDFSDKTADLINLQHYVIKEKRLSEREAVVIFYDVVRVVEALHKVRWAKKKSTSVHNQTCSHSFQFSCKNASLPLYSVQKLFLFWLLISSAHVPLLETNRFDDHDSSCTMQPNFPPLVLSSVDRKTLCTETSSSETWC